MQVSLIVDVHCVNGRHDHLGLDNPLFTLFHCSIIRGEPAAVYFYCTYIYYEYVVTASIHTHIEPFLSTVKTLKDHLGK